MLHSFAQVIERFGGVPAFAREVGMTTGAVKQAKRRNSLAPRWYVPTADAARRLGIAEVNEIALANIALGRDMADAA
jgi:hypothetical protein